MSEHKRDRGDGRVFARPGSKFLWIQYNAHGRQIRESSGETDPKKAEKKLKLRTGGVRHGIVPDSRGLRYEDLREAFFDDYISKGKKSIRHDKDGKPYLEAVKRLDTYFAGFRAVEIDADSVRKFQRQQLALGMANGSINRSVAALRRMFKLAQEDEKIRAFPDAHGGQTEERDIAAGQVSGLARRSTGLHPPGARYRVPYRHATRGNRWA
jgi:hypothetical protein